MFQRPYTWPRNLWWAAYVASWLVFMVALWADMELWSFMLTTAAPMFVILFTQPELKPVQVVVHEPDRPDDHF